MFRILITAPLFFMLTACSVHYDNVNFDKKNKRTTISAIESKDQQKIDSLSKAIIALGKNIDIEEARWVARESVLYPKHLANQYNLVWPPSFQNRLVNSGLREKGLCYQWARDMTAHIGVKGYKTLTIQRAVANQARWREHNVISVAPKGDGIDNAIILDPWRESGNLYWIKATDDPVYTWVKYYPWVNPNKATQKTSIKKTNPAKT